MKKDKKEMVRIEIEYFIEENRPGALVKLYRPKNENGLVCQRYVDTSRSIWNCVLSPNSCPITYKFIGENWEEVKNKVEEKINKAIAVLKEVTSRYDKMVEEKPQNITYYFDI